MKLTRKGFFGTLALAIFGAPVVAKAATDTLSPLAFHRDAYLMAWPSIPVTRPDLAVRLVITNGVGSFDPKRLPE